MSDSVPSNSLLYGAKTKVGEIKATLLDMRVNGLRGDLPSDEALLLIDEIERLQDRFDIVQEQLEKVVKERNDLRQAAQDVELKRLANEPPAELLSTVERIRDSAYAAGQCNVKAQHPEELRLLREVATAVANVMRAAQPPVPALQLYKYVGECLQSDMTPEQWKVFRQFRRFYAERAASGPNEATSPPTKGEKP